LKDSNFNPKSKYIENIVEKTIETNVETEKNKTIEKIMEKVSELKNNPFGDIDSYNFHNYIDNPNIKNNIKYIESHLPKSELNDTTFIETLMEEIKNNIHESIEFLKENYDKLDAKEIGTRNGVIRELTK
jgi:uncharacterized ferredoxin-like protein